MRSLSFRGISTTFGCAVILCFVVVSAQTQYSQLWGQNGELWNPSGQLKDFTNCGYHGGQIPIPRLPVSVNIRDKGAKGDGVTDDTQALLDAIAACSNGAVLLPAGRYRITRRVNIAKSNIVLRGEGTDKTTIFFPKGLNAIEGISCGRTYSYDDGIITVTVNEVGFENIRFDFPDEAYRGHFAECGFNVFNFTNNCRDVWLRNIHIHNADNGLKGDASSYGTIENILFTATRPGRRQEHWGFYIDNCTGHHGLNMEDASHWLVRNFRFGCEFIHAIGVESTASWNVFSDGCGDDFDIDHHDPDPMANANHNLWTNIDAGLGRRLLYTNNSHGTEMYETYWCIRSDKPYNYPDIKFKNVFAGFSTTQSSQITFTTHWYESLDPTMVYPRNIYLAQLAKKRGVSYASLDTIEIGVGFCEDETALSLGAGVRGVAIHKDVSRVVCGHGSRAYASSRGARIYDIRGRALSDVAGLQPAGVGIVDLRPSTR